jgi:hypothetical protein
LKRYHCDDNGHVQYWIVAGSLIEAKAMLRSSGVTFGHNEDSNPDVQGVIWREMNVDEIAKVTRCHTDDDRGVITLSDAKVGDWFCSEW